MKHFHAQCNNTKLISFFSQQVLFLKPAVSNEVQSYFLPTLYWSSVHWRLPCLSDAWTSSCTTSWFSFVPRDKMMASELGDLLLPYSRCNALRTVAQSLFCLFLWRWWSRLPCEKCWSSAHRLCPSTLDTSSFPFLHISFPYVLVWEPHLWRPLECTFYPILSFRTCLFWSFEEWMLKYRSCSNTLNNLCQAKVHKPSELSLLRVREVVMEEILIIQCKPAYAEDSHSWTQTVHSSSMRTWPFCLALF